MEKRPYQENPPRYEYHLTDKGYDAAMVLLTLMRFGEKWYFENDQAPVLLYDRRTGQPVTPELIDKQTGETIDTKHLYAGPGPAFPEDESIREARFSEYYRSTVADDN